MREKITTNTSTSNQAPTPMAALAPKNASKLDSSREQFTNTQRDPSSASTTR